MTYDQATEHLKLANEDHIKGNYEEAQKLCYQVLDSIDVLPQEHQQEYSWRLLQAKAMHTLGNTALSCSDYTRALEFYDSSLTINQELGNKANIAGNLGNTGLVYQYLSDYTRALEYHSKALIINEDTGNTEGIAANLNNIGIVHELLSNYPQALEHYRKAQSLFEALSLNPGVATALNGIGGIYTILLDYPQAIEYFTRALSINEEHENKYGMAINLGNLGIAYKNLEDYSQALECLAKTLSIFEELGNKHNIATSLENIGCLYSEKRFDGYDFAKAEEYLLKAIAINEEIDAKKNIFNSHKSLAELYENQEQWKEFAVHFKKYHEIEKAVKNEEAKKQITLMEQRRQIDEREKGIAIERAKHEATEQLLHNVLPPSIAHRMIQGENVIAEKLDHVSVLFADIVNFTNLSQRITAEELVAGLDRIFSEFDALAEKYGLEKIKTIGDAYMVVSGAPLPRADHAEAMAQFAIEILESMKQFTSISTGEEIQIRIGIHSGEVVAGVIGKKKFAYDLWGDAVNTASRMESHGEAGKIHVSEEFKIAVGTGRDLSLPEGELSLRFIERGEMEIKGKGLMKTYFLEKA